MGKIIAFANQKGGVGKSTTVVNLGAYLGSRGKQVLCVDIDPQGNTTTGLGIKKKHLTASSYEVLVGKNSIQEAIVRTAFENVSILPARNTLAGAELELATMENRMNRLKMQLLTCKLDYDYILIDCPPSLGIVTTNAFLAADEIIVPMTPELLPLKGMRMLDAFVTNLQRVKPSLRLGGVFIARFNHRKLNKVVEQAVKSRYESITMKTRIRENIALAESAGSGKSIFEYDPNSNGAKDYLALTEEIISRNQ